MVHSKVVLESLREVQRWGGGLGNEFGLFCFIECSVLFWVGDDKGRQEGCRVRVQQALSDL